MSIRRFLFVSLVTLFVISSSFAQEVAPKSILWEVSGNGLKQLSYVLGTFHILCENDLIIKDKVKKAINSVEQLALEVNLTDMNELKDIQSLMVSTKPLSSRLSSKELLELTYVLENKYDKRLDQVDNLSVVGLMNLILEKTITCPAKAFDLEVLQLAMINGKKIIGLEHLKDQVQLLEELYSAQEIVEQLKQVDDYSENYTVMKKAFINEDIKEMYDYSIEPKFMSIEAKELLLDNRNKNWVEKLPTIMASKSTVFAVGSAHLYGELGVLNLLKLKGYVIKPILD